MITSQIKVARGFVPRKKANQREESAKAAIKAILDVKSVEDSIKTDILRRLVSWWTESSPKNRHATRYQSEGACLMEHHEPRSLVHEHVFTRKSIVNKLITNPSDLDRILKEEAIVCTVTLKDDQDLNDAKKMNKESNGWQRYIDAKINVYDTLENRWYIKMEKLIRRHDNH